MRDADIVGYACNGAIYCPNCAPLGCEDSPVFCFNETDSPVSCDACGDYIDTALTEDGQRYVLRALVHYLRRGIGNPDVLMDWADSIACYGLAKPSYESIVLRFQQRMREELFNQHLEEWFSKLSGPK